MWWKQVDPGEQAQAAGERLKTARGQALSSTRHSQSLQNLLTAVNLLGPGRRVTQPRSVTSRDCNNNCITRLTQRLSTSSTCSPTTISS